MLRFVICCEGNNVVLPPLLGETPVRLLFNGLDIQVNVFPVRFGISVTGEELSPEHIYCLVGLLIMIGAGWTVTTKLSQEPGQLSVPVPINGLMLYVTI